MDKIMARILVAEDDKGTNLMVSRILRMSGWEVDCAFDGRRALEILAEKTIDLVVTDIMMPYVDGIEVLNHIKASEKYKNIPVIGFSAGNRQKILSKLSDYQFDLFFQKPVDLSVLANKIKELLSA
jgi:CheY-like chemotaxis protein